MAFLTKYDFITLRLWPLLNGKYFIFDNKDEAVAEEY